MKKSFEIPEIKVTVFMEENIVTNSIIGNKLEGAPDNSYTTGEKSFKDFTEAVRFTL